MQWEKVTLVGMGLLGGSLGLALKERGLARIVHGLVRREEAVGESLGRGAVDRAGLDLSEAVDGADLVVLCTPIAQMISLLEGMKRAIKPGTLVTDVGSVKASVVRTLEPLVGSAGACYVGSHPMAGSERMGIRQARPDLFADAICVVTPTSRSPADAVERLEQMWGSVGSVILRLSPEEHDALVCRSSHLPHVLASVLARWVLDPARPQEQAQLCGNGFKDTTRIASGSPEMWRDIFLANRDHLRQALRSYVKDLEGFQALLESNKAPDLERFLTEAKERRDHWHRERGLLSTE